MLLAFRRLERREKLSERSTGHGSEEFSLQLLVLSANIGVGNEPTVEQTLSEMLR